MVTDRLLEESDLSLLELSLSQDEYHTETAPEFFLEPGTATKVYEDESGPILFVKGTPALRIDIQFVDNNDARRNIKCMSEGFPPLAAKARENGFKEVIFNTSNPLLKAFCIKRFGFVESEGELRKFI